jgi:hypothetical protein
MSDGQYDLAYRLLLVRVEASVSDGDALEGLEREIDESLILASGQREALLDRARQYRIDLERAAT